MTTITLTPDLEIEVAKRARNLGTTPERLVLDKLHKEFSITAPVREGLPRLFEPQDEWEQRLLSVGTPCGVSLSNEAVSSEGISD